MRAYFAPGLVFTACTVASFLLGVWVLIVALSQPSLGVAFERQGLHLVVSDIGKEASLPAGVIGLRLISIAGDNQPPIELNADALIEEPDMIGSVSGLRAFYATQEQIFAALETGLVSLVFSDGVTSSVLTVDVGDTRAIVNLPLKFWTQLSVGFVGLVIGIWLVCLRKRDMAAWMVLLTGIGLAMSSGAAGLYSARELALSYGVFKAASHVNSVGTFTFGIGILTLFLIYPRRIVPRGLLPLPAVLIGALMGFIQVVDWPRHVGLLQDGVAAIMVVLLAAILCQLIVNRRDPAARAMLGWLGVSVALGAGGFVLTAIVPTLLGREVWLAQSTAFLFFLLIYAGIALGVARYRLFDLPTWSFGMLFYGLGVLLLLLLDAALIYGLAVERAPAFAISLAVIGALYLPLRRRVAEWVRKKDIMPAEELYRRITEIPHTIDPAQKQAMLINFWNDLFVPLSITPLAGASKTTTALQNDGAAMTIAPVSGLPPLRLDWAKQGTRLFSSKDLQRAGSINAFIETSQRQNQIYLDAIETERTRINRDLHDNIGVLLVSALHDGRADRKNDLIRQTLKDLREIIANPHQQAFALPGLIADLRAEASTHLEVADIAVEWRYDALPDIAVEPSVAQTLRALFREGTNNVIRHSGARKVIYALAFEAPDLSISMCDDGAGFDPHHAASGNGLGNLENRVAHLGGVFEIKSGKDGTHVLARLPLLQHSSKVMA